MTYGKHDNDRTGEGEPKLHRIIFALTLVLAFGIGVGAYVIIGIRPSPAPPSTDSAAAVDETPKTTPPIDILLTNSPRAQVLVDVSLAFRKTLLPVGDTTPLHFLTGDADGNTRPATSAEFLNAITDTPIVGRFARGLDNTLSFDIFSGAGLSGALTLSVRSYASVFATLLEWEPFMAADLLPALHPELTKSAIKTASEGLFHDERLANGLDARILTDPLGNTLIAYGFFDRKTLIIAGSAQVLLVHTSTTSPQ